MMLQLLVVSLAWGVLAFGAVYAWAYWPLMIALGVVAGAGLATSSPLAWPELRGLAAAMSLVAAATTIQLVPLPVSTLKVLSPATLPLLDQLVPGFAADAAARHPLSIDPALTRTALALFAILSLTVVGVARLLSRNGATGLVERLAVLGVVVALIGIVQGPTSGRIYGFWQPEAGHSNSFGPFVNRNHFAGWMLMAVPLALGPLWDGIAGGLRGVKPDWRHRLLWFSSPEANRLMLLAGAVILMALSLVLTMSRSGMSALAIALLMAAWLAVRSSSSGSRKAATVAYLTAVLVVVVGWVGADAIAQRFGQLPKGAIVRRSGAWSDALGIARDVPLTGTGLNTYGVATLFYQRHDLTIHYAQAHNDYLQLAAEGGVLLLVPTILCVLAFVVAVRRRFREDTGRRAYWLRAGAVLGLVAVAFQESVEFSLQMPGNAALFAVLCGIALHRTPAPLCRPRRRRVSSPPRPPLAA
jgi:O-antigen ligase